MAGDHDRDHPAHRPGGQSGRFGLRVRARFTCTGISTEAGVPMSNIPRSYAELRCKTCYSFLTGASHPHEMVEQAASLGLQALAITDQDGVYGLPRAFVAAQSHPALKL